MLDIIMLGLLAAAGAAGIAYIRLCVMLTLVLKPRGDDPRSAEPGS